MKEVGGKYKESEIKDIVVNGRGGMPGNLVDEKEAEAVAKWLSEKIRMPCRSGGEENLLHIRVKKVLFFVEKAFIPIKERKKQVLLSQKRPKVQIFV